METKSTPSGSVPKHRACDECRTRKLACSKEPDGCARCRRERIRCHYSPQKPMGRPRKKRLAEETPQEPQVVDASTTAEDTPSNLAAYDVPLGFSGESSSFEFLPHAAPTTEMDFLDLLPSNQQDSFALASHPDSQAFMPSSVPLGGATYPMTYNGGMDMSMDLPDANYEFSNVPNKYGHSLGQYMATHAILPSEPAESTPSELSNASPEPLPASTPNVHAIPNVNCGCLSSLYLTLDALGRLPTDIMGALRTVRNASKVAHEVINCYSCLKPINDDAHSPPPMQSFQSMMCLGTLVPTACNAYARILEMVDAEADLAQREGRMLWFSFKEIGGLWSHLSQSSCLMIQPYNNTNVDSQTWRRLMRGIVRLDVHGLAEAPGASEIPQIATQGLRDVVRLLEERSAKRHDLLDEIHARGEIIPQTWIHCQKTYTWTPPEQRPCMRVLDTARMALNNLEIA